MDYFIKSYEHPQPKNNSYSKLFKITVPLHFYQGLLVTGDYKIFYLLPTIRDVYRWPLFFYTLCLMNNRLFLLIVCVAAFGLHGQAQRPNITLQQRNENLVAYFPYSSVRVIDTRLDTTKIYTEETGYYPPHSVTFAEPATEAIKKYINTAVQKSDKGSGELLIRIERLHITNIIQQPKYYKRISRIRLQPVRQFIQFQATAYTNEKGNYKKLLTIKRENDYIAYQYVDHAVSRLLNDCIRVIAWGTPDTNATSRKPSPKLKKLLKDTASFQFAKEANQLAFEQIDVNVRNNWKQYPVIKESNLPPAGICYLFDDFKNNRVTPTAIHAVFNEKDSLYRIPGIDSLTHYTHHWGVFDGANWYIRLSDSTYCQLTRQGDTFTFYIPASLPDMYALLSIQARRSEEGSPHSNVSSGNIIASLIADLVSSAVQQSIINAETRAITKQATNEGLKNHYRHCSLNMDDGDIIYKEY